jgi:hypothetical protein
LEVSDSTPFDPTRDAEYELALKASRLIVSGWESIPEKVEVLIRVHGLPETARESTTRDMKELVGGEEVYAACKKFLEAEGEP